MLAVKSATHCVTLLKRGELTADWSTPIVR